MSTVPPASTPVTGVKGAISAKLFGKKKVVKKKVAPKTVADTDNDNA